MKKKAPTTGSAEPEPNLPDLPEGSMSKRELSRALRSILAANGGKEARELAAALIRTAKDPDNPRCVSAAQIILDRVDGPLDRKIEHTGTVSRLVIHGIAEVGSGPMLTVEAEAKHVEIPVKEPTPRELLRMEREQLTERYREPLDTMGVQKRAMK